VSWTQKKRASVISRCLTPWLKPGVSVLDVGCGNGEVSMYLQESLDLDLHGTDIIDYRKNHNSGLKFTLMRSPNELPFADDMFDMVLFCDVLHHMENVEAMLLEGNRLASKAVFVFEDHESVLLKAVDIGLNYFYCRDMPCPLNFRSQEEWCSLFEKLRLRFEIINPIIPFWYPFEHMAFLITKDPVINVPENESRPVDMKGDGR